MANMTREYNNIPEATIEGLRDWADHGKRPGQFLEACLQNNLMEAVCRADFENLDEILSIAIYIYNKMPGICHGSEEVMALWEKRFNKGRLIDLDLYDDCRS